MMQMAEQDGQNDSDLIEDQADQDHPAGEMPDDDQADNQEHAEDDEVIVTIGEESPPPEEEHAEAPEWVKQTRAELKERNRRNRELEQEVAALKAAAAPVAKPVELGVKPTLADCDYDEDDFELKLTAWHEKKVQVEAEGRKRADEQRAIDDEWKAKTAAYDAGKTALKVQDFEDVESEVTKHFSVTQKGIIISGAKDSALLLYAIGKNPAKLAELAAIKDPVKFCFAVAQLEPQLKVTPRKTPPPPEKPVRGGAPAGLTNDATLKRLEEEAERSGNRTKVIAYKKQKSSAN